jgi:hypothetical protein
VHEPLAVSEYDFADLMVENRTASEWNKNLIYIKSIKTFD